MVDVTLTLYNLFLGNQDSVTGWFKVGYVIEQIEGIIQPTGTTQGFTGMGPHGSYYGVLYTVFSVKKGDVVKDSFDRHYRITNIRPWTIGDELKQFECDLEYIKYFPFIAGFFGFEIIEGEIGNVLKGFEDGFERGYWAL